MPHRILLLDHTAALGGGEIALLNLVRAIDRSRFEPVVVLFAEGPLEEKLRQAGAEVHILPLDPAVGQARKDELGAGSMLRLGRIRRSLQFVRQLKACIRRLRPALIHCNSLKSDLLGGMAGRLARVPVVWHVRDRIVPEYLPANVVRVFRRLCRWIPRRVIANSHATLATLALARRHERRARVVHDGVPSELIATPHTETPADPQTLSIGIMGRISPWKGQDVFLRAAAQVRRRFPQSRFQIIGAALFSETAWEQEIHALADSLELGESVQFLGFRADVPAVLAGLDILVHASTIGEPFGQVVAEGMAAGKPVIATAGGGVPEIIVDGQSGLLVPMGDVPALAAAMEKLAGDAALRARLGAAGRARIAAEFTIEKTARGVEAVWEGLLAAAGKK